MELECGPAQPQLVFEEAIIFLLLVIVVNVFVLDGGRISPSHKGSWEQLTPIPTVQIKFALATFILATFVHMRNISALTDPILTKL